MGICGSGQKLTDEERKELQKENHASKKVDKDMHESNARENLVNKLLLLGAGESGKSTLFKQMITLYGKGFPDKDRMTYELVVYGNTIGAMQCIIEACAEHGNGVQVVAEAEMKLVKGLKGNETINEEIGNAIKTLWSDPGIQACYANRSKFQLIDSAAYYFNRIDTIMADVYLPDQQDVLRSRVRTTGIVETSFEIDQNQFRMFDVGGQRNERKKWIHCFENVTAVLFIGVLSEYDQTLYEDESTNRMVETLQLFDETVNSRWFTKTSVILFLNKRDLFEEKIKKVPLNVCPAFADYTGPQTYEEGCNAIEEEFFSKRAEDNKEKEIYSHITCATDTGNVQTVFNDVKDIIIRQSLAGAGLV